MNYPPYEINNNMLNLVADIMKEIGEISNYLDFDKKPNLRKQNRINSIHSSLAIENNQLSKNQVKDVIDGHMVIGAQKDIQGVKNAYNAYEEIDNINPYDIEELKRIHGIMTFLTVEESGKFRNHNEGVKDGDKVIFVAPPYPQFLNEIEKLFKWINEEKDNIHPLILSSVFHYEFVFIHPFSDGNGRMARLWQTTLLSKWKEIFKYLPIESMIKKYQKDYYDAIAISNTKGNSDAFIEFMLKMIYETILETKKINKKESRYELSDIQNKIVKSIETNSYITQIEIANNLKVDRRTIIRNINELREKKIITREGNNRSGHWRIL